MNTRGHWGPLTSADTARGVGVWAPWSQLAWVTHKITKMLSRHLCAWWHTVLKARVTVWAALWASQDTWKWSLPVGWIMEGRAFSHHLGWHIRSIAPPIPSCLTVQSPVVAFIVYFARSDCSADAFRRIELAEWLVMVQFRLSRTSFSPPNALRAYLARPPQGIETQSWKSKNYEFWTWLGWFVAREAISSWSPVLANILHLQSYCTFNSTLS